MDETTRTDALDASEAARRIHERCLVLDAHADIVLPDAKNPYIGRDGRSKVHPDKLRAGGVDAVVMCAAVEPARRSPEGHAKARALIDAKIEAFGQLGKEHGDTLAIVRTADEIEATKAAGKIAILLGFQNAYALGDDPSGIDAMHAAGARVFGLNHIAHNAFSDSSRPIYKARKRAYEPKEEHGGLSSLGRDAIDRINRLGGVVDVSQLSRNATLQAIERSTTPVVATHSNVRAISDTTRNLSDEEIDAIGATGGVIHVTSFSPYLVDLREPGLLEQIHEKRRDAGLPEYFSYPFELYWEIEDETERNTFLTSMRGLIRDLGLSDVVDHVDYIRDRIGIEHIGVGNDFNHGTNVKGYEDASEASNLTVELLRRGYGEVDIAKIWSGNFLRALRASEAGRSA